ncbi:MAG TPA: methionyl-tRNA formyltransferase [Candidatus Limnocylindrales bacterium]
MSRDPKAQLPARTIFIGSGRFGVDSLRRLDALASSGLVELVAVVTAAARPAGRHGEPSATPVDRAAHELGLAPVLRPERLRAPDAIKAVVDRTPELIVLADYGQLIPRALLELRFGALNLHPSLLPRHRGASPIPATILAGDDRTGVTLMRMDEGLDSGPIIAQEEVALDGDETAPDLEAMLAGRAAGLLERSLGPWVRGEIEARPQPTDGVSLTRPLRRQDGRLDPSRSARALERQVRAYLPWPGSYVETPLGRIVVHRAAVVDAPTAEPGTLVADGSGLALATPEGALRLIVVQPAGGRQMTSAELRRGRPGLVGTRATDA